MFVQRDVDGNIVGRYANLQKGLAEEWCEGAVLYVHPHSRIETDQLRRIAYANPITGSDRFFAEAVRLSSTDEVKSTQARTMGEQRYDEIKEEYPWETPPT